MIPAIQQSNPNFTSKLPTKTVVKEAKILVGTETGAKKIYNKSKYQLSFDEAEQSIVELIDNIHKKPLAFSENIKLLGKSIKAGFNTYVNYFRNV